MQNKSIFGTKKLQNKSDRQTIEQKKCVTKNLILDNIRLF